jgi:hypothetical protein
MREDSNPDSAEHLRDSIDWPSLDLRSGPVFVDIGFLGGADHRTGFRMIFGRLLDANRELLDRLEITSIVASRPLDPGGSALSGLPATMSAIAADAARVADVLYDSLNPFVDLRLANESVAAQLRIGFDNPEFLLAWQSKAG